jgi:hypothetical protein
MEKDSKWDEANEPFMDFVNDMMGQSPDDEMIEQSGQMLSYFSHFIVSIEKSEEPEFKFFFQFVVTVDESNYSSSDKQKIMAKFIEVLRNVYSDFYAMYNFFDL